ncbi:MAG: AbrB/MazE/SpoVT family DNA-binding domain-containing protein [Deltaproteobacteria bacterium]|nr:AbrB/MazE/SpoVT family DNA-binding domain-containing protein [Deltaproteobacteria bacterium]
METVTQIKQSGRITIPSKMRMALGIQAGDKILIRLENGSIRMIPLKQAIHLAQQTVRKYVPEGTSLVETLIQARREEASRG